MKRFSGKACAGNGETASVELTLDRAPPNEIGTAMLADLEQFAAAIKSLEADTSTCIIPARKNVAFPLERTCASSITAR